MVESHYELCVQTHFSAAHHLRDYPGDCAKPHGHNWTVSVHVICHQLNEIGIGIDFREVKAAVKGVLGKLDHSDLNTLPEFQEENPSSEAIARHVYRQLSCKLNTAAVRVAKVALGETPSYSVVYWEE
jgi:6-pyruvoyltetrahydropterin/6-carboxytetrahydropterin synthase